MGFYIARTDRKHMPPTFAVQSYLVAELHAVDNQREHRHT
jgi:hypothetical protein